MRKSLILLLLLLCFAAPRAMPRAEAMDPVTIAILTPIAIKGAQIAAPYVMRALMSGARHMASMGYDLVNFFRLPLGALQATVGIPFGQLGNGVRNMASGGAAPFKFLIKTLLLPLAFCQIGDG